MTSKTERYKTLPNNLKLRRAEIVSFKSGQNPEVQITPNKKLNSQNSKQNSPTQNFQGLFSSSGGPNLLSKNYCRSRERLCCDFDFSYIRPETLGKPVYRRSSSENHCSSEYFNEYSDDIRNSNVHKPTRSRRKNRHRSVEPDDWPIRECLSYTEQSAQNISLGNLENLDFLTSSSSVNLEQGLFEGERVNGRRDSRIQAEEETERESFDLSVRKRVEGRSGKKKTKTEQSKELSSPWEENVHENPKEELNKNKNSKKIISKKNKQNKNQTDKSESDLGKRNILNKKQIDKSENNLGGWETAVNKGNAIENKKSRGNENCPDDRNANLKHGKKAERLREFDDYFSSLLVESQIENFEESRFDKEDVLCAKENLGQLLNGGENESGELERIQDLFPNDNLRLFEKDPISQKMKGLMRKRSTTAARLQRAFSAKGLRSPEANNNLESSKDSIYGSPNHCDRMDSQETPKSGGTKQKRQFLMETPVQFTTGVQSQERHLFFFTDLLLVAKPRSGGNFKLKENVRVSELWLSHCIDDVTEVTKNSEASFVLGWPTTNVVASFSCVATKDLWYNKLSQAILEEREKEPSSTTIQVTHYDPISNTDICKTVSISSSTTARECISLVLDHLELPETDDSKFQLWVKTPRDESPYPLIGHELPFSIKMNCLKEILRGLKQDCDAEQCSTLYNTDVMGRCQFILRQERKPSYTGIIEPTESGKKFSKKLKKSPIKMRYVFKRSHSKGDMTDGSPCSNPGVLFGHSLQKICDPETGAPPRAIMDLLHQLFLKAPFTVGIFRKSANARLVRELKEKLNRGEEISDLDNVHITAVAALLKDFLRSLPDCLLCCDLYEEWLQLPRLSNTRERVSRTYLLCSRLPRPNLNLLQFFLCVLHHISKRAAENMMSASNLAVCVGPSLLWPSSPILALSSEACKEAPATVEFLIEKCCNVFGKDILTLLGDPPDQDPLRLDSGAEESDSLHSLHSGHSIHSSGGLRRDDSSIDSLEREFIGEGELSPLPRKDKMSLTNLSRDSGLTMSDSQLYTPDEEESGSSSSSHSGGEKNQFNSRNNNSTQPSNNERFHYTAPNNPNAIYAAVHRRQDKPHIQYDEHDGYYSSPVRSHTRVQVTYSNPSYNSYSNHNTPTKEYTRVYQERHRKTQESSEEPENIYSVPSSRERVPTSRSKEQHLLPFVANSNFQRHDWMRRVSNLRKVAKTNSSEGSLVRSASEESLLNKSNCNTDYELSLNSSSNNTYNCTDSPSKAHYTLPYIHSENSKREESCGGRESPLRRSKSAQQIDGSNCKLTPCKLKSPRPQKSISKLENSKWLRSKSTPQIHEDGDRSYDSSTLSDDDSTPHVSRSNSRGKEYGNAVLHTWECGNSHDDSHNSRNSSFKSERTGSMCTVVSAGSTSTLSSNPPSYEEALNRKSLMQKSRHSSGQKCSISSGFIPEYAIREEKVKSARAKQLYEESLRIYKEENTYPHDLVRASPAHIKDGEERERPPPLPPKSDPPPLPPKQKLKRSEYNKGLKQLPPVHIDSIGRKGRSTYSQPSESPIQYEPPLHKTIIYTDNNMPNSPNGRTVIEVETGISSTRSPVEKKSIETQTDDCDLLFFGSDYGAESDYRDESIQTSGSWCNNKENISGNMSGIWSKGELKLGTYSNSKSEKNSWKTEKFTPHITSVKVNVPDSTGSRRRSRARRRNSSCIRSRSMPGRDSESNLIDSDSEDNWSIYDCPQSEFNTSNAGLRELKQLDPALHEEISWSVSQLRAIFGDSLKGAKVHPPPYRPPPFHSKSPISTYYMGSRENFLSPKRPQTQYGEESYV